MKVWMVSLNGVHELDCCWSTKEKAIEYFKGECKECGWDWSLFEGDENDADSDVAYEYYPNDGSFSCEDANIYMITFDEKPYY